VKADFPRITDEELKLISELVWRHAGIRLGPEKRHLVELRLGKILRKENIPTYSAYYRRVMADPTGKELRRLLDAIATNYTQFFREPQHFEFLKDHVIPELKKKGKRSIAVLSAGCATGEEPYSIAMTLLESPLTTSWHMEVIAGDISSQALAFAREGVYPPEALKAVGRALTAKYFEKVEKGYRVKDEVKRLVRFVELNLLNPLPWRGHFDVVFCRNVMIYFDPETRKRTVKALSGALKPEGYLIVGHVEGFFGLDEGLRLIRPSVYQRVK